MTSDRPDHLWNLALDATNRSAVIILLLFRGDVLKDRNSQSEATPKALADAAYVHENKPSTWHALYTRHQHEKKIANVLAVKGFDAFCPVYASARKWKDRTKLVHFPLFPCYVFLNSAAGSGFVNRKLDIISTPGIHGFVSQGGEPAVIPSHEVDAIRRAVESGARIEPHPFLKCGERVRIMSGSMGGLHGIISRTKNVFRVVLSVEMLGRAAAVEVDARLLERTAKTQRSVH